MADDRTLIAPALPAPQGPPQPVLAPQLDTPLRPWERHPATSGSLADLQGARRVERYGAPVAPVFRAVVTSVLVVAAMVAGALSVVALWDRRSLVVALDGDLARADLATLTAADDAVADAAFASLIATAVAGLAVIVWTYRAYRTVAAWRPIELRLRWTVLGWIVPVVNLIVPARILTEIVEGSSSGGHGRRLPVLWWLFWTVPIITSFGLRNVDPTSAEGFVVWDTVAAATAACSMLSGAFLVAIVVRSTNDQRRRIAGEQPTPVAV